MQMNQCTADKEITQDEMSGTPQIYICTDENLRMRDFSTDIQQTKEEHRNKLLEI